MTPTQEEKFKQAYDKEFPGPCAPSFGREYMRKGWQACLEANGIGEEPRIPEGYFKIGEEVMACDKAHDWVKAVVSLRTGIGLDLGSIQVSRIPAWEPKKNDPVLYKDIHGNARPGIATGPCTIAEHDCDWWPSEPMKPFEASKIGLPWSEL